ncbi:hypothetical protein D4R86_00685 [bacterium]|nr:MAG: hypothetical protein D4R86_00685 [bacterium]
MNEQDWMDGLSDVKVSSPTTHIGWCSSAGDYDYVEGVFRIGFEEGPSIEGKWTVSYFRDAVMPFMFLSYLNDKEIKDKRLTPKIKKQIQLRANEACKLSLIAQQIERASHSQLYLSER